MAKLTPKQKHFVEEYLAAGFNGKLAAERAGYSKRTAKQIACNLLDESHVQEYLKTLQAEIRERNLVTVDATVAKLREMRDIAIEMGQMGPAVRAEELVGKTSGLFVDRHKGETDSPSRAQIFARMKALIGEDRATKVLELLGGSPKDWQQ